MSVRVTKPPGQAIWARSLVNFFLADRREYRASFPAPDVSEFWSLTVYGEGDRLVAHNSTNRHHEFVDRWSCLAWLLGERHMIAGDDNDVFTGELTRFLETTWGLPTRRPIAGMTR
jgi:hypothetical protein